MVSYPCKGNARQYCIESLNNKKNKNKKATTKSYFSSESILLQMSRKQISKAEALFCCCSAFGLSCHLPVGVIRPSLPLLKRHVKLGMYHSNRVQSD